MDSNQIQVIKSFGILIWNSIFFWIQSGFGFEKLLGFELIRPILKDSNSKVKNVDSHTSTGSQNISPRAAPAYLPLFFSSISSMLSRFSVYFLFLTGTAATLFLYIYSALVCYLDNHSPELTGHPIMGNSIRNNRRIRSYLYVNKSLMG